MKEKLKKPDNKPDESLRILEEGKCIETGKKPNKHWLYYKVHDLSDNSIFYFMYILTEDSHITTIYPDEEFEFYFVKLKELRRKKLKRLNALSNEM